MSLLDKLRESAKAREEAVAEATAFAKKNVGNALKEFMLDTPEVHTLRWTQYSPYFNDGEPCTFSVNDIEYSLTAPGEEDEDGDEACFNDTYSNTYVPEGVSKKLHSKLVKLNELMQRMETELESVFGDGVRVVVTKDGVDVEEYDHD